MAVKRQRKPGRQKSAGPDPQPIAAPAFAPDVLRVDGTPLARLDEAELDQSVRLHQVREVFERLFGEPITERTLQSWAVQGRLVCKHTGKRILLRTTYTGKRRFTTARWLYSFLAATSHVEAAG